jgi:predicted Zn-dependent protease
MTQRALSILSLAALVALSACGPNGRQPIQSAAAKPVVQGSLDRALAALNQGDEAEARKQIGLLLKANPADASALVLQESLDRDPVELLGPKSFPYTVQPGETMMSVAEKLLGNKLKFYQLARYNGVKVPDSLTAGTVLKIPGEPLHAAAPPTPVRSKPAAARSKTAVASKAAAPGETPAIRQIDPAAAQGLRSAALVALNRGKIGDAVRLLRRAAVLDPANPLIARDLARAERIAKTVQDHR